RDLRRRIGNVERERAQDHDGNRSHRRHEDATDRHAEQDRQEPAWSDHVKLEVAVLLLPPQLRRHHEHDVEPHRGRRAAHDHVADEPIRRVQRLVAVDERERAEQREQDLVKGPGLVAADADQARIGAAVDGAKEPDHPGRARRAFGERRRRHPALSSSSSKRSPTVLTNTSSREGSTFSKDKMRRLAPAIAWTTAEITPSSSRTRRNSVRPSIWRAAACRTPRTCSSETDPSSGSVVSRNALPPAARRRSAAGESSAISFPLWMIATRSQSSSASCM